MSREVILDMLHKQAVADSGGAFIGGRGATHGPCIRKNPVTNRCAEYLKLPGAKPRRVPSGRPRGRTHGKCKEKNPVTKRCSKYWKIGEEIAPAIAEVVAPAVAESVAEVIAEQAAGSGLLGGCGCCGMPHHMGGALLGGAPIGGKLLGGLLGYTKDDMKLINARLSEEYTPEQYVMLREQGLLSEAKKEIGDELGITRRLDAKELRKLRNSCQSRVSSAHKAEAAAMQAARKASSAAFKAARSKCSADYRKREAGEEMTVEAIRAALAGL